MRGAAGRPHIPQTLFSFATSDFAISYAKLAINLPSTPSVCKASCAIGGSSTAEKGDLVFMVGGKRETVSPKAERSAHPIS